MIGVGVIGCGSAAKVVHFPAIASVDGIHVVAVNSRTAESAERAAKHLDGAKVYATHEELVKANDVDVVLVSSPNTRHYEHGLSALQAGKHVIVEKPMTSTNRQAWHLVQTAVESGLQLRVASHHRYWTQHRMARQMISDGIIGEVHLIRSSLHETWHLYQDNVAFSDFRLNPAETGAGTLFDQGSHRADLLNFLADSTPRRLVATVDNVASPELDPAIDDLAAGLIEYENGIRAILTTDKFSPAVSNITEIYGTEGTIFASSETINPFQSVPLAVYSARKYSSDDLPTLLREFRYPDAFWVDDLISDTLRPRWTSIVPARIDPFATLWQEFRDSVANRVDPTETAEQGAWAMEILSGMLRSADSAAWVDLPLTGEQWPPGLRSS